MALLFYSQDDDPEEWRRALLAADPGLDVRVWPDAGDAEEIDAALVWRPPPGFLRRFPNLRLIQSLGAGVDHIFRDPDLPAGVPIARLVDPALTGQMVEYVLHAVLRHQRHFADYDRQQREQRWRALPVWLAGDCRVGILGLGAIGGAVAAALRDLGYRVGGWSRSPRDIAGIDCCHGSDGLEAFLAGTDILVCLLPLTRDTEGVINARTLAALPQGAYVINAGRGGHVVADDLLAALDSGRISGACLDVFRDEPLPPGHRFWTHPAVTVTPHVAALTVASSAMALVADNLRRVRSGVPPLHQVDPAQGY